MRFIMELSTPSTGINFLLIEAREWCKKMGLRCRFPGTLLMESQKEWYNIGPYIPNEVT